MEALKNAYFTGSLLFGLLTNYMYKIFEQYRINANYLVYRNEGKEVSLNLNVDIVMVLSLKFFPKMIKGKEIVVQRVDQMSRRF